MAIFKSKKENLRELGFGSRTYQKNVRFITLSGDINVKRSGLRGLKNIDIYHYLTTMSAWRLSIYIAAGYISVNLIFGGIYYWIGPENFYGVNSTSPVQQFLSLFFFSAQTITTLGYGHLHPVSNVASVAAAVESLLGLLTFAIATGIIFGRFSRTKDQVMYSNNLLIAPYGQIKAVMFRIANKKQYELIEAEATVNLTMTNPETNKREFHNLDLEINKISFFPLSWTIVHPIDEKSPLFGLQLADLEAMDVEILILIKAISDTFGQTVYSRASYKPDQIIADASFRPLVPELSRDGKLKISVRDIHHYDQIKSSLKTD